MLEIQTTIRNINKILVQRPLPTSFPEIRNIRLSNTNKWLKINIRRCFLEKKWQQMQRNAMIVILHLYTSIKTSIRSSSRLSWSQKRLGFKTKYTKLLECAKRHGQHSKRRTAFHLQSADVDPASAEWLADRWTIASCHWSSTSLTCTSAKINNRLWNRIDRQTAPTV